MRNTARETGTKAENFVKAFLEDHPVYQARIEHGAGETWHNVISRARMDSGDIHGPHTAIEVKARRSYSENDLLEEAEHKGYCSGRRLWLLVYKAPGYGAKRVGMWHALTTVEHLLSPDGWGITPQVMSSSEFVAQLPDLVRTQAVVQSAATSPVYEGNLGPHTAAELLCTPRVTSRAQVRDALLAQSELRASGHRPPLAFVISPRRGKAGPASKPVPPEKWFAYSRFWHFRDALEAVGAMPPRGQ